MLAAADVFHLHALPKPLSTVANGGIVLFAMGWVLKSLVLLSNPFATPAVRVQRDGSHAVSSAGPYRFVRHPFYAADPLIFFGLSLWLESYLAALCTVVPLALIVARLQLEERLLQRQLPGYSEYSTRVRYRLLPGVW
jgi:protein-S-isoprenylcysteine O-methyltransferase Ste14